jgi:hypothetical protein
MKPAEMHRLTLLLKQVVSEIRLLRGAVDALNRLLAPNQKQNSRVGEERPTNNPSQPPTPLAALRTIAEFSDADKADQKTEQDRNYRLQRRAFRVQAILCLFTAFAFGAAAYYAYLFRRSLVGSQAATVTLALSLYPNSTLSVGFDQRGVVAAKTVCFVFHAVRKTLPDFRNIESPISHTACEPVLSDKIFRGPQDFALPGLTPNIMEAIRRTEQTVMVTGEFSYDNGFGDIERQNVCQYWLSGIPNKTEAEGGANGFFPCEGFSVRLNNVLKARSEGGAKR